MTRSLVALLLACLPLLPLLAGEDLPAGAAGFSGQVRGTVVEKGDGVFTFKVAEVLKVWKGSTAAEPGALAGFTILVKPRDGSAEVQARFVATVRAGEELTVEVKHAEGRRFVLLELSEEQARRARGAETAPEKPAERPRGGAGELPDGVAGFSGRVRGVVLKKLELEGNVVSFRVDQVQKTWKANRAETPEALAGRTIRLGPAWSRGDNGRWSAAEAHVRFLGALTEGEELTIEIRHSEREIFAILELSEEQRARAGAGTPAR